MSVQLHPAVSASRRHSRVCRRRISHDAQLLHCSTTTYSSLYSPPGIATPLYPQQFLPTELLLIIFNFVFDDLASYCADSPEAHKECVVCGSSHSSGQRHVVWDWQEDVSSYALFPYSLAGVCRRWRDIMATVPQFWTRLIVFVDDPLSTSLPPSISSSSSLASRAADIYSHLKWSAQLPIEVYILRRRHSTSLGIDGTEHWKTRRVFEAIKPHIHRCHVLRFSVLQSTSLPSLVRDFARVRAPVLTDLRLECEIDDTWIDAPRNDMFTTTGVLPINTPIRTTTTTQTSPTHISRKNALVPTVQSQNSETPVAGGDGWFWCPNLSAISLNGRNFRELALALRHPITSTGAQGEQQLNLIPAVDFYMTLQHVEKVTVAYYSTSPELESGWGSEFGTKLSRIRHCDGDIFRLEDLLEVVRRERMPRLGFLKLVDLDLSVGECAVGGWKGGEQQEREAEVIELASSYTHLEELAPSIIRCFSAFSPANGAHPSHPLPGFRVHFVNGLESFNVIRSSLPSPSPSSPTLSSLPLTLAPSLHLPSPSLSTGGTGWVVPDACDLALEEINDLYGGSSPLRKWQGCRLLCTGCNGVDDEFLKMLRSSSDNNELISSTPSLPSSPLAANPILFNAPNLQSIYLNDCNNYTIDELKSVIEVRNARASSVSVDWDAPPCIVELCVKGIRPELREVDRRWFGERVRRFEWGEMRGRKW